MQRLRHFCAAGICALLLMVGLAIVMPAGTAQAVNFFEDACSRGGEGSPACDATGANELTGSNGVITRVTNIIAVISGITAIGFMVYAGFTYVTSGGDTSKIGTAKSTIIYALVGLIIIGFSRTIILFVISRA